MLKACWRGMTPRPRDIVAVIGTTGVGKSQLAISLAHSLRAPTPTGSITPQAAHVHAPRRYRDAVVLSADSMQLYRGLDVITNKVTEDEKAGVEHWGLDVVTPGQEGSWEMGKWCGEAGNKVHSLDSKTLPIVCGGTHYFIQHFLFPPGELSFDRPQSALEDPLEVRWKPPRPMPGVPETLDPALLGLLESFWTPEPAWPRATIRDDAEYSNGAGPSRSSRPTTKEDEDLLSLWTLLREVDPMEAGRWHWRDGRKVRRGLERWWERGGGEVASTSGNDESDRAQSKGRRARLRTLIFWVYEPVESLRPRLDKRVEKMLENGLLREIAEMREIALKMYGSANTIDHTEGVFQSIGYKEFADLPLPQPDPASDTRFAAMLALTKSRTYQYAKSQVKWIRKQLLPAVREARALGGEVEIYVVPGGTAGEGPAKAAFEAFLAGDEMPSWQATGHADAPDLLKVVYDHEGSTKVPDTAERQVLNSRHQCDVCSEPGRPFSLTTAEWDSHIKSRSHKGAAWRAAGGATKKQEQLAMRENVRAEREALKQQASVARAQAEPTV